jgi:hydrogenase maturation protease
MGANQLCHPCLILACGNIFRGDDGAAWHLVEIAQKSGLPEQVKVIAQHQWTPELAEDISLAEAVLFVDCSLGADPGSVSLDSIEASATLPSFLSHHTDPASLMHLAEILYERRAPHCALLAIGAEALDHTDQLSESVKAAMPKALELLLGWVRMHTVAPTD